MKKLRYVGPLLLLLFALTACGRDVQHTTDDFLEDLDYMIYVLENNFALLEVANWAHGIDYRELEATARRLIIEMDEPCRDMFLAIMAYSFAPLNGTGHFRIIGHVMHSNFLLERTYGWYRSPKHLMNLDVFRESHFYEHGNLARIERANTALDGLFEAHGRPETRFDEDGFSEPVTMEIIEEGRIAYISSGRHSWELSQARLNIIHFYNQIADFEHLIIDLRGNTGGDIDVFLDILIAPHLTEPVPAPQAFYFFLDGPYVRRFGDLLFHPTISSGQLTITEPYRPAHEILEQFDLPEINRADIDRLHYGAPANRYDPFIRPRLAFFNGEPAFEGKIWVLTDHSMTSAANLTAWHMKEIGLGTLVGETTGGAFGGPRTAVQMPNTGVIFYFDVFYVTDERGRPLEAGIIPHYFNRPGLDALETALALIAE